MLHLLFMAGGDYYAVPAERIEIVVPFPILKNVPGAPSSVAGILNYRGRQVVVIDCGVLLAQKKSSPESGTRIILCHSHFNGTEKLTGLLGEHVRNTVNFEEKDFNPPEARAKFPECAGPIAIWNDYLVQIVLPEKVPDQATLEIILSGDSFED